MATMADRSDLIGRAEIESVEWVEPKQIKDLDDRMELFDGFRCGESRLLRCKNALFTEYHYTI